MKLISSCLFLLLLCSANAVHAQQALIAPEKVAATLAAPNVASIISSNDVVAVQVRTSNDTIGGGQIRYKGLFNIGTADGRSLLFQYPQEPITSHFNVRIDGVVYSNDPFRTGATTLPLLSDPLKLSDGTITCTYQVGRITIEQRLTPQQYTATTGAIFIQYLITNNDGAAHQVGLLLEMDTFIITNDAAPISTSFGYSRREQQFTAPFIPDYFQAFERNDLTQPGVVAQGTLIGRDAVRPDLVFVGDWANLSRVPWDYMLPNQFYNDSAVILRWNERRLAPGESRVVATYFGRGDVSFSGGTLALNLTAPHRLEAISGQLTPNPFEVNLVVTNAGFVPATSVQATLNLPQGLALVSGEFASKLVNPSDLNSQQSGTASWKVLAQCPVLDDTLTFNVTVTATNPLSNSVSREIMIPSCAASLPNFTLTTSPSSRSVIAGDLTTYAVSMQASGGFTGNVGLSFFPSTPGVTSTFVPSSINATTPSTLTLQTTRALAPGTYSFVINGEGGGLTRSDTVALVVQAPPAEDKTPPFTINHNPARGARNVPLNTDIVVEVDDAQFGVDRNTLIMNVVGVTGVTEITEIRSAPKAYRLRFQPAAPFRDNQRVEVRINAADMAAPPNVMPTDIYTFTTVRDSLPPFTLDHFPARGATNVPSNTVLSVEVRDDLTGVNQNSLVMQVNGLRVNPAITGAQHSYNLSLSLTPEMIRNDTVRVSIDAADLAASPNQMPADRYFFVVANVKDVTPPFAINHRPAKGTTNVPLDADIRIEIRDDLSGVDRNALSMEVNGQAVLPTITPLSPGYALQFKPVLRYNATVVVITAGRDLAQPANVMPPDTLRFSTIRDVAPPFATDHLPAKGAANAPASTNISLHVRDLVAGVDRAALIMNVDGARVSPVITGTLQDYQLEYNPPNDFALGDTVRVSIAAQDLSNPPNVMPVESYLFIIQPLQEALPDLAVTQLEPAGTFFVGVQGTVIGEIVNTSEVSASESFSVQFRVDGGVQKDTTFSQLAANARVTLRLPLRFQTTGTHAVELEVDVGKKIREVTEANNSQKLVVQISQSPALSNRLTARPNPFTPNNDGFNDQIEFDYSGLGLRNPSLQIFDTNGIAVWSNDDGSGGRFFWNGRDDRGRDVTPGVYLYSLRDQGNNVASGYVVVAR